MNGTSPSVLFSCPFFEEYVRLVDRIFAQVQPCCPCSLYQLFVKEAEQLLCFPAWFACRTVQVEGKSIDVPLLPAAATDSLDGLAKEVYTRVFDWLVDKINESTHCAKGALSGTIDLLVSRGQRAGIVRVF